jgi:hypothetical protein
MNSIYTYITNTIFLKFVNIRVNNIIALFLPKIQKLVYSIYNLIFFPSKNAHPQSLVNIVAYEDKYKDCLKSIIYNANSKIENPSIKSPTKLCNFVLETTPKGQVIMRYNDNTSTFEYYTDSGTLPHKYLETVCRRYVIVFQCPHLYTDMTSECEKMYKFQQTQQHKYPTKKQNLIVKQKINKFIRLGKLSDFNILQTVVKELPKLSFSAFKKLVLTN